MRLSIMVATMPSRAAHLATLVESLRLQDSPTVSTDFGYGTLTRITDEDRSVELLAYCTPPHNGVDEGLTFGAKRNAIAEVSKGEYILCFDDDDLPHEFFVEKVIEATASKPDVIGYKVACYGYANGCNSPEIMEPADVSTKYDGWYNDRNGFKYVRCPHHIVPVRREHLLSVGFRVGMHHGEDHEYSMRLRDSGLLKSEVYIDDFMYIYRFNGKKKRGE